MKSVYSLVNAERRPRVILELGGDEWLGWAEAPKAEGVNLCTKWSVKTPEMLRAVFLYTHTHRINLLQF